MYREDIYYFLIISNLIYIIVLDYTEEKKWNLKAQL